MDGIEEGEREERTHAEINERVIAELKIWPSSLGKQVSPAELRLVSWGTPPRDPRSPTMLTPVSTYL